MVVCLLDRLPRGERGWCVLTLEVLEENRVYRYPSSPTKIETILKISSTIMTSPPLKVLVMDPLSGTNLPVIV